MAPKDLNFEKRYCRVIVVNRIALTAIDHCLVRIVRFNPIHRGMGGGRDCLRGPFVLGHAIEFYYHDDYYKYYRASKSIVLSQIEKHRKETLSMGESFKLNKRL